MEMTNYTISPYTITMILSFVVSYIVLFFALRKRHVPANIIGYSVLLTVTLVIYGAKMYGVVLSGFRKSILNSGIGSMGGVIGLFLGVLIFGFIYKEKRRDMTEGYFMVVPLLYAIAKIGCHLVGCCNGISYDGPFAVTYHNNITVGGPYFPVQITETIVFFLIFLVSLFLFLKQSDYLVPAVLLMCAIAKFSLEYLREEHIGKTISANQAVCIFFALLAVWWIVWNMKKCNQISRDFN